LHHGDAIPGDILGTLVTGIPLAQQIGGLNYDCMISFSVECLAFSRGFFSVRKPITPGRLCYVRVKYKINNWKVIFKINLLFTGGYRLTTLLVQPSYSTIEQTQLNDCRKSNAHRSFYFSQIPP
jgi:hypothetical protein